MTQSHASSVPISRAEASSALPDATLSDWKTYSDFIVSGTVVGISREEPSEEELKSSSVAIAPRIVTLRIDQTLWSAAGASGLPEQIRFAAGGWLVKNGEAEKLLLLDSAVNYEEDGQYLLPLTLEPTLSDVLSPLSARAPVPFNNGVVGQGEQLKHGSEVLEAGARSKAWQDLWGLKGLDVKQKLADVVPDPLRRIYPDLSPLQLSLKIQSLLREK